MFRIKAVSKGEVRPVSYEGENFFLYCWESNASCNVRLTKADFQIHPIDNTNILVLNCNSLFFFWVILSHSSV